MQPTDLPPLREDLQLQAGPTDVNGAPTWTIYDPVRNRYLRLSALGFEIVRHWQAGPIANMLKRLKQAIGAEVYSEDIHELLDVLVQNQLIQKTGREGVEQLERVKSALRAAWYKKLLHKYLFFKIPLIHPDRFLHKTKIYLDFLYQPVFYMGVGCLGLLGLFLLLRDWSRFTQTVPDIFSFQNLIWGMVALWLSKIIHEFAHAYTAARLNCRVPTMGVAFMVMWPVLYTDLSDTWRLVRRKDRLRVASAGMISELVLALLATLLWALLPDGGLKEATFMLATLAWVMTLAINLNPFMRFDGYYIFADALGIENLQDRSFALAKWHMREWFLGLNAPAPEALPRKMRTLLIAYAYATWVYRFFLFLGIALLVYYMFFKALGLFLMIVEVIFFIARPVWNEVNMWWSLREKINLSKPVLRSGALLVGVLLFLFIPWQNHISAPAVMQSSQFSLLYPGSSGQLLSHHLKEGKTVSKDEVLFRMSSLELDYEIGQSQQRLFAKRAILKRLGTRRQETERWQIAKREVNEEEARLRGLIEQRDNLSLKAPFEGVIRDVAENLHSGRWLSQDQIMARLVQENKPEVLAYVGEQDYHRLLIEAEAKFISNNIFEPSVPLKTIEIAKVNTMVVEHPGLIEKFGGHLPAKELKPGTYIPATGIYKIRLIPTVESIALDHVRFGSVSLEANRESIIKRFIETVGAVLIRESGF